MEPALAGERAALQEAAVATPTTRRPPVDVRPERTRSFDVDAFPVPTGREEEWRFTPMAQIGVLLDAEPSTAELAVTSDLPDGVELLRVGPDDPVRAELPLPVDRLAARALQEAPCSLVLRVPKGLEVDRPILLTLTGSDAEQVVWGSVVLDLAEQSRATVVLEHAGSARYSAAVSVLVGDGAALDLVQVNGWADDAVHGAHVGTRLGRDARLRSTSVTYGGALVRVNETVDYAAPGGDAELRGVALATDGQHLEHRLLVTHTAPHCRSRVTYKNALQGDEAHTVWVGDVVIRAGADGTDSYELNRNLLLTPQARADSVPNLEIETGEITGAGHASATGRFDDEQLFYLQSRGIPADVARRLVVRGFFAEVVEQIGVPELEERLMAEVERELARTLEGGA